MGAAPATVTCRRWRRSPARLIVVSIVLFSAGCATIGPPGGPAAPAPSVPPSKVEPPPPNVNLQGFPLPYRQGYADGCASVNSAEHKDATRFRNDGQYRTGWQDGNALCKKR